MTGDLTFTEQEADRNARHGMDYHHAPDQADRFRFELGDSLLDLAADVHKFTNDIVPQPSHAPALKCATEAQEFAAEPSTGEAADVLITLLGWISLNRVNIQDLLHAAQAKMTTNLARTWQQQPGGTWQHVGDAA